MNPQPRNKQNFDARKERLDHARLTGEWLDFPCRALVPLGYVDGKLIPNPTALAVAKRRRDVMMDRMEIENQHKTDPKLET